MPSPAREDYRFPAEWEPHAATWLSWPHEDTFGTEYRDSVENLWIRFVEALHHNEAVHILVPDQRRQERVVGLLQQHGIGTTQVFFHRVATDDFWIRDNGPLFVKADDGSLAAVGWQFNAWGQKYPYQKDRQVPGRIAAILDQPIRYPEMVLEGGAVDFNGRGTCLTTESVLLNPNRNPHLTKPRAEAFLRQYLGVSHVVWLPGGDFQEDQDTDGHIDGVARFVDPRTIVCRVDNTQKDYELRLENYRQLLVARDQDGNPFNVVALPGRSVNFYIANGCVLVPTSDPMPAKDRVNLQILQGLFPDRDIVTLDCTHTYEKGGAIHCVTQQQPA